jgi:hypothetical protein
MNVDYLANEFAEIKNTMTIIFFIACRSKSSEKYEEYNKFYDNVSIE